MDFFFGKLSSNSEMECKMKMATTTYINRLFIRLYNIYIYIYIYLHWGDNMSISRGLVWYKLHFIFGIMGAVINYIDAQVCISLTVYRICI